MTFSPKKFSLSAKISYDLFCIFSLSLKTVISSPIFTQFFSLPCFETFLHLQPYFRCLHIRRLRNCVDVQSTKYSLPPKMETSPLKWLWEGRHCRTLDEVIKGGMLSRNTCNTHRRRFLGQPGHVPPIIEKRPCIYHFLPPLIPQYFGLPTQYF